MYRKCGGCGLEAHTEIDLELFKVDKSCLHNRGNQCKECDSKRRGIQQLEIRNTNKIKLLEYVGGSYICSDCGFTHEDRSVFDFHHLDPKGKEKDVGQLMHFSWGILKRELDKCALLCANCHRIRHIKKEKHESICSRTIRRHTMG